MGIQHKRLCKFNTISKYVRTRRINREIFRVKLAKAMHIPNPRLVLPDGSRLIAR